MDQAELIHGTLFDIQGFSVHDGPGCRTLIFLKGCSLRCCWCSNPEGITPVQEPLYQSSKCTFDLLCAGACKQKAISVSTASVVDPGMGAATPSDNTVSIKGKPVPDARSDQRDGAETNAPVQLIFDRTRCAACTTRECLAACCTGALRLGGYKMTTDELFHRISRDRPYWGDRGGITLTGGEPFAQPRFVAQFLKKCYDAFIHTAAETCGNVPWNSISDSLPFLDWIFFDLKHMDPEVHHTRTGSTNHHILHNALQLSSRFEGRLIFRLPVIPGFNDDCENIDLTAEFLQKTGRKEINILPLHHLGREKYALTGRSYDAGTFKIPSKEDLVEIRKRFTDRGIACYIGSDTPF